MLFNNAGINVAATPIEELALADWQAVLPGGKGGDTVLPPMELDLAVDELEIYRRLHGLSYRVLRLSNPYGPRQNPDGAQGAASVFTARAHAGESLEITLTPRRSLPILSAIEFFERDTGMITGRHAGVR